MFRSPSTMFRKGFVPDDARGNMTADPVTGKSYSYQVTDNQLHNVPSPFTTLNYDALGRLWSMSTGTPVTKYVSDGNDIIAEYDGSDALQKRYAFDPGSGQPLVAYDSSGNRSWMMADERGSVIALANDSGAMTAINTYDEYGIPGSSNEGTFQYAGMLWLSRAGLYAPTFRAFNANQGRFNQTDPIGMAGGVNLYAYVGNDPVNLVDPLGLACVFGAVSVGDLLVCGERDFGGGAAGGSPTSSGGSNDPGARRGGLDNQDKKRQPSCNTVLPNGRTVGEVVRQYRAQLKGTQSTSIQANAYGGEASPLATATGAFLAIVSPGGPIDFKNSFRGHGNPQQLGLAGNFAYYAIGGGILPTWELDAGAGAYGLYAAITGQKPFSDLTGPMFSDASADSVRDAALASAGCAK